MLAFDEARRRVLAAAIPLGAETVRLDEATERVLAEDLRSESPLPYFDASAMDGFAVRLSDLSGAPPYTLPIRGVARAGGEPCRLEPGTAVRIFTGAELPEGADAVVIQEDTVTVGDQVEIRTAVRAWENLRRAGEDLPRGALALPRGARLAPFQLGLVASLDQATIRVSRRPQVALISTGDELRAPGSKSRRGSIPDSNRIAIGALAARAGARMIRTAQVGDQAVAVTRIVSELAQNADLIVTVGGVSVGEHDVVREALCSAGATLDFWKVAIKPGKPLTFGTLGNALFLGLPGNPVSAQVTFALFGIPLLRTLQGDREPIAKTTRVVLDAPVRQKPGRLGIYRAQLRENRALIHGNQASGSTVSLAQADALVFVPPEFGECPAGSELDALRLVDL